MNTSSTIATPPVTPARPGRPTTFSQAIVDLLCAIIRKKGVSDSAAAILAGVHPSTLSRWKREHPDLALDLLQARELFRDQCLTAILETIDLKGGWRAAAWLLERTFPADYHPKAAERERFREMQEKEDEQAEAAEAAVEENLSAEIGNHPAPALRNSQNATSAAASTATAAIASPEPHPQHRR